jgi:chemosensory pili system protein ChpA (sensor histidine kinase/response regulator)
MRQNQDEVDQDLEVRWGLMVKEKSILIVDDHDGTRQMMRWRLELDGFRVLEAVDGSQCISKLQLERPDLIVLDLSMPRMNGLQVARTINRTLPQIPLLMFTENTGLNFEQAAWSAGVTAFIDKSGGLDPLVTQVNTLLGL